MIYEIIVLTIPLRLESYQEEQNIQNAGNANKNKISTLMQYVTHQFMRQ